MQVEFKVYQKFQDEDKFKLVGFERINNLGNWEYMRNGRENWILGTISDNQGNAQFKRMQFVGMVDRLGCKIHLGDKFKDGTFVVFRDGQFGTTYEGNTQGLNQLSKKRTKYKHLDGNIFNNL